MHYSSNISQDFYQTMNESSIWGVTLESNIGKAGEKEKDQEGKGQAQSVQTKRIYLKIAI